MIAAVPVPGEIYYPTSDGKRMAENTLQFRWIMTIQGNLEIVFVNDPNVFVAGDNLIYPVKGKVAICTAPDVYVAVGRPKGDRGSYQVWKENGIFPQVVFEVLSPGNTAREMAKKKAFYRKYGAEEYYVIDPDAGEVEIFVRDEKRFVEVTDVASFVSPRLGIRFDTTGDELVILRPDGTPFRSFAEMDEAAKEGAMQKRRADAEKRRADTLKRRVGNAEARAEEAEAKAKAEAEAKAKLAAKLREMGIDPDTVT